MSATSLHRAYLSLVLGERHSFFASFCVGEFTQMQKNNDQLNMYQEIKELKKELKDINDRKLKVEVLRKRSMWRRTIGYPLIMVLITVLTAASIGSVVKNVGQIVAGFKSLPAANQVIMFIWH